MAEPDLIRVNDPEHWDKEILVMNHSLFTTKAWLSAVALDNRCPVFFEIRSNDKVIARIAGLEISFKKKSHRQLFFYAGFAYQEEYGGMTGKWKELLLHYAREKKYLRLLVKSYDCTHYTHSEYPGLKQRTRFEYCFELNRKEEEIIKAFDKDVRRRIRKARNSGAVLQKDNSVFLVDRLLELLKATKNVRQEKGYSTYSYMYMPFLDPLSIRAMLEDRHAVIYYVGHDTKVLSAMLVFCHGNRAYALLMGTSPEGYKLNIPSFLLFEIAMDLKRQGYRYYNLGGVPSDPSHRGIRRYKKNLGVSELKMVEEATGFLNFPLKLLNPLLHLERTLPDSWHSRILKKTARKAVKVLTGEESILL